jgi:hypothetical protein
MRVFQTRQRLPSFDANYTGETVLMPIPIRFK